MAKKITLSATTEKFSLAILSKTPLASRKWGSEEHNILIGLLAWDAIASALAPIADDEDESAIRRGAMDVLAERKGDMMKALLTSLAFDGAGGNSSQLRQKLAELGHIPKSLSGEELGDKYAGLLS